MFVWIVSTILCSHDLYNYNVINVNLNLTSMKSHSFIIEKRVCYANTENKVQMCLLVLFQYLLPLGVISLTCLIILYKSFKQIKLFNDTPMVMRLNSRRKVRSNCFLRLLLMI